MHQAALPALQAQVSTAQRFWGCCQRHPWPDRQLLLSDVNTTWSTGERSNVKAHFEGAMLLVAHPEWSPSLLPPSPLSHPQGRKLLLELGC